MLMVLLHPLAFQAYVHIMFKCLNAELSYVEVIALATTTLIFLLSSMWITKL